MKRRKQRQTQTRANERLAAMQASLPDGLRSLVTLKDDYLETLRVRQYASRTVLGRNDMLSFFILWCLERDVTEVTQVTKPILERYQRHLYHYRKPNGKPMSTSAQCNRVTSIKQFFSWLTRENYIPSNPASELLMPRREHRLPKAIFTKDESEAVLSQPDIYTPLGIRDRAMMETLYSTGMRRAELMRLQIGEISHNQSTVMIRQGKGKRDRVIPIGDRALAWVEKYEHEVRPSLLVDPHETHLFLTEDGKSLPAWSISKIITRYINRADISKEGSTHIFRHTMATLMLENGADIRYIQQMLGHALLTTTQIYTQVSIEKLKQIHKATHPAKLERPGK